MTLARAGVALGREVKSPLALSQILTLAAEVTGEIALAAEADEIATRMGERRCTLDAKVLLARLHKQAGRLEEALAALEQADELRTQMFGEATRRKVEDLQVERRTAQLRFEKELSERLLHETLPASIAARLLAGERTIADRVPEITVLFADVVGFTELAAARPPEEIVQLLDRLFHAFDDLAERHGLEKIKTMGDSYMVAGPAVGAARLALDMLRVEGSPPLRIGLATGPVVAGVIGRKRPTYDLWGDTVNLAARMESHGAPGQIHLSESARLALGDAFTCEPRGEIEIKGMGRMSTHWLRGHRD
jgi:class 3 adenylate cyclase